MAKSFFFDQVLNNRSLAGAYGSGDADNDHKYSFLNTEYTDKTDLHGLMLFPVIGKYFPSDFRLFTKI